MEVGKMYFFTATILDWNTILFPRKRKLILIDSLKFLIDKNSLKVYAFVIMPNHIHVIWKPLSPNLQLQFMKYTSQQLKFDLLDKKEDLDPFLVNKKDRTYQIWQRNPLAIELYSLKVIEQKLDYIHANPVQGKWMLAYSPIEYEFSSASFYEDNRDNFGFLTHYLDDV